MARKATAFAYEEARLIATRLDDGAQFFKACGHCRRVGPADRRVNDHNGAYCAAFPPPWARRLESGPDPRAGKGRRSTDG